jgi:hypothetical protein
LPCFNYAILAGALAAGAIVGIILAALIIAGLSIAGGTTAAVKAVGTTQFAAINSNPLYNKKAQENENALFNANDEHSGGGSH